MKTAIYIKTCQKDFGFLKYCLLSIRKFASNFDEFIIQCGTQHEYNELMSWPETQGFRIIHEIEMNGDGYLFQQVAKLQSFKLTECEKILFVDSDCVFFRPFNPDCYIMEGKPMLLKTNYSKVGDAIIWKGITERAIGWGSEFEWMRRLPMMHLRETLVNINNDFPSLPRYIMNRSNREFSEFNFIGYYVEKKMQEKYEIIDTDFYIPPKYAEQYWSWSKNGVKDYEQEIIKLLE